MKVIAAVAAAALSLALVGPGIAAAQSTGIPAPDATASPMRSVDVFGARVVIPPPLWEDGRQPGGSAGATRTHREADDTALVFEQIPADQDFATWDQLYAVRGFLVADAATFPSALAFAEASLLRPYEAACGKDNIVAQVLESLETQFATIFLCERSAGGPAEMGYGAEVGEMQVYRVFKVGTTFVEVFHKWRGPAFERGDKSTWPVSEAELGRAAQHLSTVSAGPLPER